MINAGIDLGDIYSSIAHVNAEGIPTVIPDAQVPSRFETHSVVHLGSDGALVGDEVNQLLQGEPDLPVARHAKSALGDRQPLLEDPSAQGWSAAAINALLLAKLRRDAEASTLDELGETVIAVPSHFADAQRRAVRRSAQLAGLSSVALVDESVAAAAYLSQGQSQEQTVLVYDLGGGSFQASVLRVSRAAITLLASTHDATLGGRGIDELLVELMRAEWSRQHGDSKTPTAAELGELRRLAEQNKKKLSQPNQSEVHHRGLVGNKPFEFFLTRHHFERLIQPHVDASLEATEQCLQASDLDWSDLDQIMLIGGSTLIPLVRQLVSTRSNCPADAITLRHPQHCIAFGAALLANQSSEQGQRVPALSQATANYDLGVRIRHPRTGQLAIYNLIKRNSQLPSQASKIFKTTREDQTRLMIEIVQSRGNAHDALSLGYFSFGPIEQPRVNYPIEVTMQYDHEGLVQVSARAAESGQEIQHQLEHRDDATSSPHVDREGDLVRKLLAAMF